GVRIVDWQSWRVDTGTDDLAYMMACHWYPEYRARWERPLVEGYHRALLTYGVVDYPWPACWYDYRASVIRCLFFLLGSWHPARPASMWWERLEKGLLAYEDLGCAELLAT
ncbi:MAG: aminoglycoside phosphotransferase, partial [Chloroflexota bacterium]